MPFPGVRGSCLLVLLLTPNGQPISGAPSASGWLQPGGGPALLHPSALVITPRSAAAAATASVLARTYSQPAESRPAISTPGSMTPAAAAAAAAPATTSSSAAKLDSQPITDTATVAADAAEIRSELHGAVVSVSSSGVGSDSSVPTGAVSQRGGPPGFDTVKGSSSSSGSQVHGSSSSGRGMTAAGQDAVPRPVQSFEFLGQARSVTDPWAPMLVARRCVTQCVNRYFSKPPPIACIVTT